VRVWMRNGKCGVSDLAHAGIALDVERVVRHEGPEGEPLRQESGLVLHGKKLRKIARPVTEPAYYIFAWEMTHPITDITIIGGGPTGLFASFYTGMRGATAQIVDALPELGGQLTALYPE